MIKYDKFNEFYYGMNIENDEIIEKWKKIKLKKHIIFLIAITICLIVDVFICMQMKKAPMFNLFLTVLIISIDIIIFVFIEILFANKSVKQFNNEYKEEVINKLLENFIDELDYVPLKSMPRSIFNESHFGEYYNKYYSDDYFEGKINDKKIIMSNLLLQKEEVTTDSDGEQQVDVETIFDGLFGKIELKKSINSTLTIGNNQSRTNLKNSKLDMDFYDFEKVFDVYSSNEIIGMQLLTLDIQEDILELYTKYKINFNINIINNKMYVLFNTGSMFEVFSTKKSPTEVLEKYFDIMKFISILSNKILAIIDNTKI